MNVPMPKRAAAQRFAENIATIYMCVCVCAPRVCGRACNCTRWRHWQPSACILYLGGRGWTPLWIAWLCALGPWLGSCRMACVCCRHVPIAAGRHQPSSCYR
eukprot:6053685-Amphidinium_carterae.1